MVMKDDTLTATMYFIIKWKYAITDKRKVNFIQKPSEQHSKLICFK